ncbi:LLM class F420-dependent oxidoreductase [Actinomadura sp. DC4]|uniref:LLM class F420-dependent oxidoreductase n=1 Tax=Actinomadura sp. DC4 TaxID=3055069 RepID=UPI0025AFA037|nr:LLM class F420-dependent oxidoreductase [Actinomadura sp. DC4]MDN3353478.1 LLM class F420-dependent oxidoreductase [Actinomadura sp. DC4]
MDLGQIGIWNTGLRDESPDAAGQIREAAAELEELGFGAIWLGGSPGVRHAVPLLAATSRIVVATGILNIWEHDPAQVAAEQAALAAEHPGRFLLGLGASHAVLIKEYRKPYSAMVDFLDGLDAAGSRPEDRVLAALGPRMLALSRDRAAGAHPYLITADHTVKAREILGAAPLLAPEVKVVLEEDPALARAAARGHLSFYLSLPNYTGNLLRLGFGEEDLDDGGSDRLIDAAFAWGGPDAIRERVAAHRAAGADHVVLQVVTADNTPLPREQWRELASILTPVS